MSIQDASEHPRAHAELQELFESIYRPMRLLGASKKTLHQHTVAIKHFRKFLGREPLASDLDSLTIARLMQYMAEGRTAITVNKTVDKLLAQWRFLFHQGIVGFWPEVRKLPESQPTPTAWLDHEMAMLFTALQNQTGYIDAVPAADWWIGLHLVIYDSAERIGAVMGLEWTDYDPLGGWLNIRAELRKGKKNSKMVKLHPDTMAQLQRIVAPRRKLMFPWPKSFCLLWTDYTRILKRAGLANDRRSKFHRIRRTVASHFTAAGGDATDLLDHTNRRVTKVYLDPRLVQAPQASDLLPRPWKPGDPPKK